MPMQPHEARRRNMHVVPPCRDNFMSLSMNQNCIYVCKHTFKHYLLKDWDFLHMYLKASKCTFSFGFPFQLWLTSALSAHKMYAHARSGSSQAFYTQILTLQMAKYPKSQSEPSYFFGCVFFSTPPSPNKQRSHNSAFILFQKTWTGKLWTGFALKSTGIILL